MAKREWPREGASLRPGPDEEAVPISDMLRENHRRQVEPDTAGKQAEAREKAIRLQATIGAIQAGRLVHDHLALANSLAREIVEALS